MKYTKESAANVLSAICQYLYLTLYFMLVPFPTTVDTLTCFMEFMARTSGHPHLKHLLSSVKFAHEAMDILFPINSFQIDVTMQGLKRKLARVPYHVLPITSSILKKMFVHLNMSSMQDRALWCSYLVAFYGLLRKSNAVPKSKKVEVGKVLVRRNVMIDLSSNMVYIYLGYGKTNNFCTRDVIIPIPGNNDPALDPVSHLKALFSSVTASQEAPDFSYNQTSFIVFLNVLKAF